MRSKSQSGKQKVSWRSHSARWLLVLLSAFSIGLCAGCERGPGFGDDDQDGTSTGEWTLISRYNYQYDQNSDLLLREVDDNNANNYIDQGDVTWQYTYDSDDKLAQYMKYEGTDLDPAGIGAYYYDGNGCNYRLEEETPGGTDLQVWTYNVNDDCTRNSYQYEGDDVSESGTYSYDDDGFMIELKLNTGEYWKYTPDDNGERLRYDFYTSKGNLYRYGNYFYDINGRLSKLENYERR